MAMTMPERQPIEISETMRTMTSFQQGLGEFADRFGDDFRLVGDLLDGYADR